MNVIFDQPKESNSVVFIGVIYYYAIWTDNGSTLPEANTRRQDGEYPMMSMAGLHP